MLDFLAIRGIDGKQFFPVSSAWSAIARSTSFSLDGKSSSKTPAINRMLTQAPPPKAPSVASDCPLSTDLVARGCKYVMGHKMFSRIAA